MLLSYSTTIVLNAVNLILTISSSYVCAFSDIVASDESTSASERPVGLAVLGLLGIAVLSRVSS